MNVSKEDDNQPINVTDPGSPRIENIVEVIDPPQPQAQPAPRTHPLRLATNGQSSSQVSKRPKVETNPVDEYDSVDMVPPSHFLPEVLAPPDDSEVFGKSVAAQLRHMSRPQKVLAQRLISEVCFRGQIQALSLNTALSNQQPSMLQQVPQPVLPPYACKPLNVVNNRPSEYLAAHHTFSSARPPPYASQPAVGPTGVAMTAYQGCISVPQQHPEALGPSSLGHGGLSQNDVMP